MSRPLIDLPAPTRDHAVTRRTVAKGAAWAAPAMVLTAPAPAAATSSPVTTACAYIGASFVVGEPQLVGGTWSSASFGLYQDSNDLAVLEIPFTLTLTNDMPLPRFYATFRIDMPVDAMTPNYVYEKERYDAAGNTALPTLALSSQFQAGTYYGGDSFWFLRVSSSTPLAAGTYSASLYLRPGAPLVAADVTPFIPDFQALYWDESWAPWATEPATDGYVPFRVSASYAAIDRYPGCPATSTGVPISYTGDHVRWVRLV